MSKTTISKIKAREILDSRGDPTIEVTVVLAGGEEGLASVPSGASTGIHEAYELRDGDKERYEGKGVLRAIHNIETQIDQALNGLDAADQKMIDQSMVTLDGTPNKHNLGANAILGVSLACARAVSVANNIPLYEYLRTLFGYEQQSLSLPVPMMNILNGGRHADNAVDIQEFMVVPKILKDGKISYKDSIRAGSEVFHTLGQLLKKHNLQTDVGNEGGYAPRLESNQQALDFLVLAIKEAGYKPGEDISLALDIAASEFFKNGKYVFEGQNKSAQDMIVQYNKWLENYPIISIEDGLSEDDWQGWQEMTRKIGSKIMLVGDDLFVTNSERLNLGLQFKAANAVLIKPNQIGSLCQTIDTIKLAQANNYNCVISHRSGETTDAFIVDLAVAVGAPYIKAGSVSRGERVAKYNRLMDIEQSLTG